jgi:GntR family transcriptional regulator, rspAB operon transcriptional repressor
MDAIRLTRHRLDRSRPATIQVFDRLRESIMSLTVAPGTVLSRVQLAEQFGVSSTPVRDALLKLEEEGLVEIFPQHATVVSPIDLSHARQAHFLRRSLEVEIARTLALAHDQDVADQLEANLKRLRAFRDAADLEGFTAADEAFHRHMYEAAGVPNLWPLIHRQSGHLDRLRRLHLPAEGKADDILRDHQAIVRAIARGEPEKAETAMRRHLSGTLAQADRIRAKFPTYFRS